MDTNDLPMVAAKKYKRRCWWVDVEDLTQEAWPTMLRAKMTFDPSTGVPEQAYLWRAVVIRLKNYVWSLSSPVSANDGEKPNLAGVLHERLHPGMADRAPYGETLTIQRNFTSLIDSEVRHTIMRLDNGELAADMLISGYTLSEVCQRHNVARGAVLSALAQARKALAGNLYLQRLWRERCK